MLCIDRQVFRKIRRSSRSREQSAAAAEGLAKAAAAADAEAGVIGPLRRARSADGERGWPTSYSYGPSAAAAAAATGCPYDEAVITPAEEQEDGGWASGSLLHGGLQRESCRPGTSHLNHLDLGPCRYPPTTASRWLPPKCGGRTANWQGASRRQPKADPVSRGAQLRAQWSRDRFLVHCREYRKLDLKASCCPAGPTSPASTLGGTSRRGLQRRSPSTQEELGKREARHGGRQGGRQQSRQASTHRPGREEGNAAASGQRQTRCASMSTSSRCLSQSTPAYWRRCHPGRGQCLSGQSEAAMGATC